MFKKYVQNMFKKCVQNMFKKYVQNMFNMFKCSKYVQNVQMFKY